MHGASAPRERADPCTMVIFGALGDLSRRKLLPAIYQLMKEHLVDDDFAVLGVGRDETQTDDTFREQMRKALGRVRRGQGSSTTTLWQDALQAAVLRVGRPDEASKTTTIVGKRLAEIESVARAGDAQPDVLPRRAAERVRADRAQPVEERPRAAHADAGRAPVVRASSSRSRSAAASRARMTLNDLVLGLFAEHQTYRIDHYLGKETVQNVLVLRFANSIFEPLWNRQWIDHVQITAAETVGVEERGKYYEEAGVVRDMFQNHLLQLLTLTAMEPPPQMSANAVRDEKVKVLKSIRWLTPESIRATRGARAVHRAARSTGKPVPRLHRGERRRARLDGADVRRRAIVRRQLAMERRAVLSAIRQATGKSRVSEIAVQFRAPPHLMFGAGERRAAAEHAGHARAAERGRLAQLRGEGAGRRRRADVEHRDRAGRHEVQLRRGVR